MGTEQDDTKEKVTPPAPSADKETERSHSLPGDGDGDTSKKKADDDKEPMIPKHRFDEVANRATAAENRATAAEREILQFKARFDAMANALGDKQANKELGDDARALTEKYNLQDDFVRDLLSVSTAKAKRELAEELKPLKQSQAQAAFEAELRALEREFPEVAKQTAEERKEFLDMAFQKRYQNVPLIDVWKIRTYGKPAGKSKTAEPGRGGGGRADDEEPDIKNMSLAEFEKYSNDQARKK